MNVKIITADMNKFQITEQFDRVVSIEMFEHMKNYELLFQKVSGWLRPGGMASAIPQSNMPSRKAFCPSIFAPRLSVQFHSSRFY